MYYAKFDFALLSLFTIDMLQKPFTITDMGTEHHVFQSCRLVGIIRPCGTGFDAHKVVFMPPLRSEE